VRLKKPKTQRRSAPRLIADYEKKFSNPYISADLGYTDEVIEPALTRKRIIDSLEMLKNKRDVNPAKKHGNIPL
jgi:propionyl-CoA carboxylase beta chain